MNMKKNKILLEADAVRKSYRMGTTRLEVLKGVNLSVRQGEFVAITGASGSGKSTLLHILGGLDIADDGVIKFAGRQLQRFGQRKLNKFRNRTVGFVFQFYHLLDELDVLENVALPAMVRCSVAGWMLTKAQHLDRAKGILAELSLEERRHHKPYQLSGGERQRVAIGRALMNRPTLLLADEPTGNLDSATGNGILKTFEKLHRSGQTIIMVTHDEKIAGCAERIISLADGRV